MKKKTCDTGCPKMVPVRCTTCGHFFINASVFFVHIADLGVLLALRCRGVHKHEIVQHVGSGWWSCEMKYYAVVVSGPRARSEQSPHDLTVRLRCHTTRAHHGTSSSKHARGCVLPSCNLEHGGTLVGPGQHQQWVAQHHHIAS